MPEVTPLEEWHRKNEQMSKLRYKPKPKSGLRSWFKSVDWEPITFSVFFIGLLLTIVSIMYFIGYLLVFYVIAR